MDRTFDNIPDDHGAEIKKRVIERDGSDGEERPTKRARANTSDLLPLESDWQDTEELPKPEDVLDKYDHKRLQRGLRFISGAAKRKVTPRTQEFLELYKEAYKVALDVKAPAEASRAVVQAMDKAYFSTSFYFQPRSLEEHDRLMHYVRLRRLEFTANYGDYLGQELQGIRADLKEAAKGASSEIRSATRESGPPKTWVAIDDELAGANMADLRKHVNVACDILGLDSQHMVWLIKEWAERNRIFHNQIRQCISDCHWTKLAEQICRDLKDLINVAPDEDTARYYEKVIVNIQEEYFDITSRDDPNDWLPNEKARKLRLEKQAKEKEKA